jgi:hypothetical protein
VHEERSAESGIKRNIRVQPSANQPGRSQEIGYSTPPTCPPSGSLSLYQIKWDLDFLLS